MSTEQKEPVTISWATRKKLAIQAFRAFLFYTLIYWFLVPWFLNVIDVGSLWVEPIQESYSWFAITTMGVVLGYMGFTTLPFIGKGGMINMQRSTMQEQQTYNTDPNYTSTYQGNPNESYVDPNYRFNMKDM